MAKEKMSFPVFEKTDGDEHITYRLRKEHVDEQDTLTEDQLKDSRVEEKNVIMEALLESKRTGSADKITEKNLNDSKAKFGSAHRNEDAYTGDINKLEEKRLAGHKMEDEKYELAGETPKNLKWWEIELGKDQLKLAEKRKGKVIAQATPFDVAGDETKTSSLQWEYIPSRREDMLNFDNNVQKLVTFSSGSGWITSNTEGAEYLLDKYGIYILKDNGDVVVAIVVGNGVAETVAGTNIDGQHNEPLKKYYEEIMGKIKKEGLRIGDWSSDKLDVAEKDVRQKEFAKSDKKQVVAQAPVVMDTEIDEDEEDEDDRTALEDFYSPQEYAIAKTMRIVQDQSQGGDIDLTITFTDATGDEDLIRDAAYHKIIVTHPELKGKVNQYSFDSPSVSGRHGTISLYLPGLVDTTETFSDVSTVDFNEIDYREVDAGGTPMAIGKITFSSTDNSNITEQAIGFINSKHPDLSITASSLDDSKIDKGEISFAIAKGQNKTASFDFDIHEVKTADIKKK